MPAPARLFCQNARVSFLLSHDTQQVSSKYHEKQLKKRVKFAKCSMLGKACGLGSTLHQTHAYMLITFPFHLD
jgi:hypothetical protein